MEDWLWKKFVFNYYKFIAFTHYNIYILSKKNPQTLQSYLTNTAAIPWGLTNPKLSVNSDSPSDFFLCIY